MSDFRARLAGILEGSEDSIATLEALAKAEGKAKFDCERCGAPNHVKTMDARTVLDVFKWLTEQTQGKPGAQEANVPKLAAQHLSKATDETLLRAAGLDTDKAWGEWLKRGAQPKASTAA